MRQQALEELYYPVFFFRVLLSDCFHSYNILYVSEFYTIGSEQKNESLLLFYVLAGQQHKRMATPTTTGFFFSWIHMSQICSFLTWSNFRMYPSSFNLVWVGMIGVRKEGRWPQPPDLSVGLLLPQLPARDEGYSPPPPIHLRLWNEKEREMREKGWEESCI